MFSYTGGSPTFIRIGRDAEANLGLLYAKLDHYKYLERDAFGTEFTNEIIENHVVISNMKTSEEMIKEKALWICVPLKPLNDGYLKVL